MEDRVLPKREEVLQYLTALWRPVREVEKVSLNRAFGSLFSGDAAGSQGVYVRRDRGKKQYVCGRISGCGQHGTWRGF